MTPQAVSLILGSGSPRRRELLACLGLPFRVVVPDLDEDLPATGLTPDQMAEGLARAKALAIAQHERAGLVLAADTLVIDGETVLGKPRDAVEAAAMLRRLRDREHRVITGLALVDAGRRGPALAGHVTTAVRMRPYGDNEIADYIARGEPFDKAGAYAIQDEAFYPVASYEAMPAGGQGCYCNVVGLPLRAVICLLQQGGVDITDEHLAHLPPECARCPLEV